MVCPLRPRCARPPLPEGEARDAHAAHQNVCRGGRLCPPVNDNPSQREAGIPRLRARGTDSHASDIGHWLGMTNKRWMWYVPAGQGTTYSACITSFLLERLFYHKFLVMYPVGKWKTFCVISEISRLFQVSGGKMCILFQGVSRFFHPPFVSHCITRRKGVSGLEARRWTMAAAGRKHGLRPLRPCPRVSESKCRMAERMVRYGTKRKHNERGSDKGNEARGLPPGWMAVRPMR